MKPFIKIVHGDVVGLSNILSQETSRDTVIGKSLKSAQIILDTGANHFTSAEVTFMIFCLGFVAGAASKWESEARQYIDTHHDMILGKLIAMRDVKQINQCEVTK